MNLFQRLFGKKLANASSKHDLEMYQARLDMEALRLREEAQRMEMHKCYAQRREEREIKSGIVVDPGGQCLCKRCSMSVSALEDECKNCNNKLDWNV